MRPIHDPTGFDVEATTFAILKRRFHAHAPGIDLNLSAPGSLIADEQPRFLTAWVPHQAHIRFQRLLLPDPGLAIPAIAWLEHDLAQAFPRLFQFAVEATSTGMFCTNTQQIMPATRRTEFAASACLLTHDQRSRYSTCRADAYSPGLT